MKGNCVASHQRRGSAGHLCSLIWNKGRKVRVATDRLSALYLHVDKKPLSQALPVSWTG